MINISTKPHKSNKEIRMYKNKEFQVSDVQEKDLRFSPLLKAKDVAEILKVSRAMAYNLMQRGEIPTIRIGKARRVRPEDLIKYIESNTYTVNPYFE
jgi:excisionase family DNA binding protein